MAVCENQVSLIDFFDGRADEFEHIVKFVDKDALFPFALTSRAARSIVVTLESGYKTTYKSAVASVSMLEWAISIGASKYCVCVAVSKCASHIDVLEHVLSTEMLEIAKNFVYLPNLTNLDISNNNIGSWMEELSQIMIQFGRLLPLTLKTFNISNNKIDSSTKFGTATIWTWSGRMRMLEEFNYSGSDISIYNLKHLRNMTNLKKNSIYPIVTYPVVNSLKNFMQNLTILHAYPMNPLAHCMRI